MPKFKCVLVPCDLGKPVAEETITFEEGDEVGCMSKQLQKYFKSGALDDKQKQELKTQIMSQMKQKMEITEDMLDMMTATETVDIVCLYPPRPADKFVGINLYCDDKGMVKNLPVNQRASEITQVVGKPTRVFGDCFVARVMDDGRDAFERQDFLMADLRADSSWMKTAQAFNLKQAAASPAQNAELQSMLRGAGQQAPEAKIKVVSQQTADNYKEKLDAWMNQKLKQYDEDEAFRASRDKKHGGSREGYAQFLVAKTARQLAKETGM